MITVIGTGIQAGDVTVRGKKAIKEAEEVYSRTKTVCKSVALRQEFSDAENFEERDERIC